MESDDEIVIVGDAESAILARKGIRNRIGAGEAAAVIPKALLLESFHALSKGTSASSRERYP